MEQWLGALRVLRQEKNVATIRQQACELAERLTGADGAWCAVHESEFCVSQSTLGGHGVVDSATARVGECGCGEICRDDDGGGVVLDLSSACPEVRTLFVAQAPRVVVAYPLVVDGRRLGTLGIVFREPTSGGEFGRRFLRMIGDAVGAGLASAFEEAPRSNSWSRSEGARPLGPETRRIIPRLRALVEALRETEGRWPGRALAELGEGLASLQREATPESVSPPSSARFERRAEEVEFSELAARAVSAARPVLGTSVLVRRRTAQLDVDRAVVEHLLATLVRGALVSLDGARVTLGVRRRGARAVVLIVERGREKPGAALYFGGVLDEARRAGLTLRLRGSATGVVWELEVPLALSEVLGAPERPEVILSAEDATEDALLRGILGRSGFEPSAGARALGRARLAILPWSEEGRDLARALRRERGPDFPLVFLARESPSAEELEPFGQPRLLRTPVRDAELVLALRLALSRDNHPRRPRSSDVFVIGGESAAPGKSARFR